MLVIFHHERAFPPKDAGKDAKAYYPEYGAGTPSRAYEELTIDEATKNGDHEDSGEVRLRIHDPRFGPARPLRVKPLRKPEPKPMCYQRHEQHIDNDDSEKSQQQQCDVDNEPIWLRPGTLLNSFEGLIAEVQGNFLGCIDAGYVTRQAEISPPRGTKPEKVLRSANETY